ncbi:MAG: 50S ribosomal protein L19e [Candidatus Methanomethylicia archaeon]
MSVKLVKRLASDILRVGKSRIWIDPEQIDRVVEAVTRKDVKKLINEGLVRRKPEKGVSKFRSHLLRLKRKKGLRKGFGSRKGSRKNVKSREYVSKIRAMRSFLKILRNRKIISVKDYRTLYKMVKGGFFKSKSQIKAYIEDKGLKRR